MKRDMDLVRTILLAVEELPPNPDWEPLHIDGQDDAVINAYLGMMAKADLVEVKDLSTLAEIQLCPVALTWKGSEFLDAIREDARWRKAKEYLTTVGAASLPVMVTKVIEWAATYKP